MRVLSFIRKVFQTLRPGTRSLKATLALYFLPISILPAIFVSVYATRVFEDNTRYTLKRRAETERDAFIAEIHAVEKSLVENVRAQKSNGRLFAAIKFGVGDRVIAAMSGFGSGTSLRVYSPSGKKVEINIKEKLGVVQIAIRDFGVGIAKDDQARLFLPFFRANNSQVAKGSGIGLFITLEIVKRHKGKLWVESKLGKGSKFILGLPVYRHS